MEQELREMLSTNGLLLIVIISTITALFVEGIKKTERVPTKYLPLLSLIIGFIIALVVALVFHLIGDITTKQTALIALSGIISGGLASGLYDNVKSMLPDSLLK